MLGFFDAEELDAYTNDLYYHPEFKNLVVADSDYKCRSLYVPNDEVFKRFLNNLHRKDHLKLLDVFNKQAPYTVTIRNEKIKTSKRFDISKHRHYSLKNGRYPLPGEYMEILDLREKEEVYNLPETYDSIYEYLTNFIDKKDVYDKNKIFYKSGLLFYGPPGNGKTCFIRKLASEVLPKDALVVWCETIPSNSFRKALMSYPGLKVFIFEELTTMLYNSTSVAKFLEFMDGEKSVDNAVYIATTNYPENLPGNVVERPGRFDRVIKFDNPNKETRKYLFKEVYKMDVGEEVINETEDFSVAQIKEVFLQVTIHDKTSEEAVRFIKDHKEFVKNNFQESRKIGI